MPYLIFQYKTGTGSTPAYGSSISQVSSWTYGTQRNLNGLTIHSGNLISYDTFGTDTVYTHSGVTSTESSSFNIAPTVGGDIDIYNGNLYVTDRDVGVIQYSGITSTITQTINLTASFPGDVYGIVIIGGNMYVSGLDGTYKIKKYVGISNTVDQTIYTSATAMFDLFTDGTNLIATVGSSNTQVLVFAGTTGTVTNTYNLNTIPEITNHNILSATYRFSGGAHQFIVYDNTSWAVRILQIA